MYTFAFTALLGLLNPAAMAADETLSTTTAAGNGQAGNMFALTALNDVEITGFQMYASYGSTTDGCDWEVYTSTSDYTTVVTDSSQWTLAGSGNVALPTGSDDLVDVALATPVSISAGTTLSFYVTFTDGFSCGVNYTNGTSQGSVFAADANLEIDEGYGNTYSFDGYFSPRIFNGAIY